MNILVTGSTGLVGSFLCAALIQNGHRVVHMVRRKPTRENQVFWDPSSGEADAPAIEGPEIKGIDAAVHLAGESITGGRWTAGKKHRILESRMRGTRLLSETLAALSRPPRVLVSASAIGYYGNRGDESLDEQSGPGTGFLPEVCREWEQATEAAAGCGIRVVIPRIGVVLSASGGALPQMLPVFRLGFGGKIGSGRQYMSWIALEDLVGIVQYAIDNDSLEGPVNAVSPEPVTNRTFAKTLGRVLARPSICALPGFAARLVFGEMADALLLASAKVIPARLNGLGYPYRHRTLESALKSALLRT